LDSKVAVITGGSSGMGRPRSNGSSPREQRSSSPDIAAEPFEELVKRSARRRRRSTTETRRRSARRLRDRGWTRPNAIFVPGDITVADDLKNVITLRVEKFGGLDVMFNNAGVGGEKA